MPKVLTSVIASPIIRVSGFSGGEKGSAMEVSITAEMFGQIAETFASDVSDSGEMIVSTARRMRKWVLTSSPTPVSVVMGTWASSPDSDPAVVAEAEAKVSAALAAL